ncbi:MAG: hypothetical protein KJN78_06840 [Gammaproteobacteria bacterium]|nr:hypothetical protein [Gammaproteobacteria bacterium]
MTLMMNFLRLLPVILSMLLLGAHFFRAGLPAVTLACVAVLGLLLLKKSWVPRLFQALLLLGVVEWLRTLYVFAQTRIAWDEPWTRLALILGGVALFTALSASVFWSRKLHAYYRGS